MSKSRRLYIDNALIRKYSKTLKIEYFYIPILDTSGKKKGRGIAVSGSESVEKLLLQYKNKLRE